MLKIQNSRRQFEGDGSYFIEFGERIFLWRIVGIGLVLPMIENKSIIWTTSGIGECRPLPGTNFHRGMFDPFRIGIATGFGISWDDWNTFTKQIQLERARETGVMLDLPIILID